VTEPRALFETAWVHAFEEDGTEGEVYRPESRALRRSRRPRERIALFPDGSARLTVPQPDDRLREVEARWTRQGDEILVTAGGPSPVATLHLRLIDDERLVVRTERG
jgi:hypothetical protein